MGCDVCSKDTKPKTKRTTFPARPPSSNVVTTQKLCFGPEFAEQELFHKDSALLGSDEMLRRTRKWDAMALTRSEFSAPATVDEGLENYYRAETKKFIRRLKKGPPPKYRWAAWKVALNVKQVVIKGLYKSLTTKEMRGKCKWIKDIRGDINRTFPEVLNSEQKELSELVVRKLENVLVAISLKCPKIGYCQGMNYVVGFMLLVSDLEEEEVFWAFIALERDRLVQDQLQICGVNGMYMEGFPKMHYIMECFHAAFAELIPKLKLHFDRIRLIDLLWAHKWIFAFFLFSFPFSYCIRFWDYVLAHGISGSIRISLAIITINRHKLEGKDFNECYQVLSSFIDGKNLPDAEEIIKVADHLKITPGTLHDLKSSNYQTESIADFKRLPSNIRDDIEDEAKMNSVNVTEPAKAASRSIPPI